MHERVIIYDEQPCVKGTHIPVYEVVRLLADGNTVENVLVKYPSLTREDVLACLDYAASLTAKRTKPVATPVGKSDIKSFLTHLRTNHEPLRLRRGMLPEWEDENLHGVVYAQDPAMYALLSLAENVTAWQRARVLFQILRASREGLSRDARQILQRVTHCLLAALPADHVLTVFLSLRRSRANHKHTSKAVLRYVLNHPQMEDLVLRRRPTVADCLEHAMGKDVARACVKMLAEGGADAAYLRRHLLRFARDSKRVRTALSSLYRRSAGIGLWMTAGDAPYTLVHKPYAERFEKRSERPTTITATNRGDISATLVHLYRGGSSAELLQALEGYVEEAAARLPHFSGRLALVLDASASSRAYGEREFCYLAQSVALTRVLEKCCAQFELYTVGGSGNPPKPEGATDLAGALLDALESDPGVVAIVSDGYENVHAGDLARVAATLPQAGVQTPVFFCHSKFTNADNLTLRRPAPDLPQIEFWHQDDFEDVLTSLFTAARGQHGDDILREFLLRKLSDFETQVAPWTCGDETTRF